MSMTKMVPKVSALERRIKLDIDLSKVVLKSACDVYAFIKNNHHVTCDNMVFIWIKLPKEYSGE